MADVVHQYAATGVVDVSAPPYMGQRTDDPCRTANLCGREVERFVRYPRRRARGAGRSMVDGRCVLGCRRICADALSLVARHAAARSKLAAYRALFASPPRAPRRATRVAAGALARTLDLTRQPLVHRFQRRAPA